MHAAMLAALGLFALTAARGLRAQVSAVTRADAVAAALARGPRLAIARADSGAALALARVARQFENPVLGLLRTESVPREHYTLDVPLNVPWLRSVRVGAADAALRAASHRYAFEREAVAYDADTAYTRALVAAARSRHSARSARDADSLLALARVRREAGDASELDLQLAGVSAGQVANSAAADSLEATTALLNLQAIMGRTSAEATITLADSLEAAPSPGPPAAGTPLLVAAADANARAAELALTLERRRLFPAPSVTIGYETRDPGGTGNRTLPSIGLALPLPLLNQNRGAIAAASAQRDRSAAALALARVEQAQALARAQRALVVARVRAARSGQLVAAADRVAVLSLLAYQEGAAALPAVLEAQRTARGSLAQHLDDLAAARNAAGLVKLLSLTANPTEP
ncbi:MAG: TolC family protein [Gemmatimonadetes bacterium]|nr:TolC family protein [Gemmatimonadota bacterium]